MSKEIVARLGETDQLYLQENSAELALERGALRLSLVHLSKNKQEQLYFLHEAIAILEQARLEFEEITPAMYMEFSLKLAQAYMVYFELTQETKFALITQQILKPLAHLNQSQVFFFLAYACACKQENALLRHWLNKYARTKDFQTDQIKHHHAFEHLHHEAWFQQLIKKPD